MTRRHRRLDVLAAVLGLLLANPLKADKIELEEVATFPHQQVTGITVSPKGRLFVCFPDWSDDHSTSVAQIVAGKPKPFPDAAFNAKAGLPAKHWICVQSVVMDDENNLWVLDSASPKMKGVVKGGAKLVKIDLAMERPTQTIVFDETVAPADSYLNDVRIDTRGKHAFITESGLGAIIVVDLKTGKARRLLADHPSTKYEHDDMVVDGMKLIDPKTGHAPAMNVDGIALDQEDGWLYYHALNGRTLYRIKTTYLCDESLSAAKLGARVEKLVTTPKPDGMIQGRSGTLYGTVYLTDVEDDAIVCFDVHSKKITTVVKDQRLQWPDTMAWGASGELYVTTSQIHRMPKYHDGQNLQQGPFAIYRVKLPK